MVKGCDNTCIKYCLLLLNSFFSLIGLVITAFGIYVLVKSSSIQQIVDTPNIGAIIIVVAGSAVFLISTFGCCGSLKENSCLLTTYGIIVVTLALLQIVGAIVFLVNSDQLTNIAKQGVRKAFYKYPEFLARGDKLANVIDNFQYTMKCCGVEYGPSDWANIHSQYVSQLPASCCFDPITGPQGPCTYDNTINPPFSTPCVQAIETFRHHYIAIFIGILIAVSVIQLLAGMFACLLSKALQYI